MLELAADIACPLPGPYTFSTAGVSGCVDLRDGAVGVAADGDARRASVDSTAENSRAGGSWVGRSLGVGGVVRGLDAGMACRLLRTAAAGCSSDRLPCVLDALGADVAADVGPGA